MKKFIAILFTLILMSIAFTAQAQYAVKQQTPVTVTETQNLFTAEDFLQSDNYQDALYMASKGRKNFFTGLGCSVLGSAAVGVGSVMMEAGNEDLGGTFIIVGGISAVVGTILEIYGVRGWANGEAWLRNQRFEFTVRANGLAISF